MEAWVFGIAVVGSAVLIATLGVLFVRKRFSRGTLKGNHEVAGYLLSIVATLYSVLLGLIVVETQGKYQEAKVMSQQEADCALDMFHIAYSLPMETRTALHTKLQKYLEIMVEREWDSTKHSSVFDDSAHHTFRDIWWTLNDYEPHTNREQSSYDKLLDSMQNFTDARRYRLQLVKSGLPPILWGVLISGGCLTVLFTYLFEVESAKAQVFMTALVALALSLNVLLIAFFNNPYKGFMRISSYPFMYDLRAMQQLLSERPDK
jgi:hypothetical protein